MERYICKIATPDAWDNRAIYRHLGFTEAVKRGVETYPDGECAEVLYYAREL